MIASKCFWVARVFTMVSWCVVGCGSTSSTSGGASDAAVADVAADVFADRVVTDAPPVVTDTPTVGDAGPLGPFDGTWTVSAWRVTRAVGGTHPDPSDGGLPDNPACADAARMYYESHEVAVDARTAAVTVNGFRCETTPSGDALTARCGCSWNTSIVCSHDVTLRLEGSPARLVGDSQLVFNNPPTFPPYCEVSAHFEGARRGG